MGYELECFGKDTIFGCFRGGLYPSGNETVISVIFSRLALGLSCDLLPKLNLEDLACKPPPDQRWPGRIPLRPAQPRRPARRRPTAPAPPPGAPPQGTSPTPPATGSGGLRRRRAGRRRTTPTRPTRRSGTASARAAQTPARRRKGRRARAGLDGNPKSRNPSPTNPMAPKYK